MVLFGIAPLDLIVIVVEYLVAYRIEYSGMRRGGRWSKGHGTTRKHESNDYVLIILNDYIIIKNVSWTILFDVTIQKREHIDRA